MQIYADVTNCEFKVAASPQTVRWAGDVGRGRRGQGQGGYDDITQAAAKMARVMTKHSLNPEAHAIYAKLFVEYKKLHDYFGRGENDVMKRLKRIGEEQHGSNHERTKYAKE